MYLYIHTYIYPCPDILNGISASNKSYSSFGRVYQTYAQIRNDPDIHPSVCVCVCVRKWKRGLLKMRKSRVGKFDVAAERKYSPRSRGMLCGVALVGMPGKFPGKNTRLTPPPPPAFPPCPREMRSLRGTSSSNIFTFVESARKLRNFSFGLI